MRKRTEHDAKAEGPRTAEDELLEQVGKRAGRADADRGAPERAGSGDPITPNPEANERTLRGRTAPRD
ncbi:hypothetical protein AB0M11_06445 [Streptomyces sp. NPDC051987]|uniref:hypothetical protein n=1 Tax=Streptomyces sp. NPDC051987 TaxID=3155808 RepID=UPI00342ECC7A